MSDSTEDFGIEDVKQDLLLTNELIVNFYSYTEEGGRIFVQLYDDEGKPTSRREITITIYPEGAPN